MDAGGTGGYNGDVPAEYQNDPDLWMAIQASLNDQGMPEANAQGN